MVPHDFVNRRQYLHARQTLVRLLELGCVPVVNENDAVANDEIRFGDNDRLAALVAHLVSADVLLLLTDLDGLFTADPRRDPTRRAHRPRGRRRPDPRRGGRRHRLVAGERGHGLQADRGADRIVVRGAGGDRQGRADGGGGRGHRRRARRGHDVRGQRPSAARPQAVDRLRQRAGRPPGGRRRRPGGARRAGHLAPARRRRRRGRASSTRGTRSTSPVGTAWSSPGGWRRPTRTCCAAPPAGARATSRPTSPTRPSTATTWSSLP